VPLLLLQSANNDGLKVGETVATWVWDRIKLGQPIKLQKPKQAWGWDKDGKDGKDGGDGKSGPSAGQKQATVSLRKPWLTVDLGKK
jgi:hypothetical protein